jgi:hypothetical protein
MSSINLGAVTGCSVSALHSCGPWEVVNILLNWAALTAFSYLYVGGMCFVVDGAVFI